MNKAAGYGAAAIGVTLLSACCFAVGFLGGGLRREREMQHQQYFAEQRVVAPLLASDPAYASLTVEELSRGGISLHGLVPAGEDLQRLHEGLIGLFGRQRASDMIRTIDVAQPPPNVDPSGL